MSDANQARTTQIKNLATLVAWDAELGSHVYIENADLVMRGGTVIHAGPGYSGPADTVVEGGGLMAMPGLVNIHTHPSSEPGNRGLLEELGSDKLGQSSLYEYMPVFRMGIETAQYANQVAVAEMLLSGVTTFVDMSLPRPGWADVVAATGIRGVLGPMFRSAAWRTPDGHSVEYAWDEAAATKSFEAALDVVDSAVGHPSGRLSAMLCPSQVDTCSPELLKQAQAEARRLGIPMQIHAAQSVVEFSEMTRRHGRTPIEWLDDQGLLNGDLIIGHGIFLNDHRALYWPHADDFGLLQRSGAHVAHCPTVFARRGIALSFLGRYLRAGINVGMGTDTFPHNMLDEMRLACYVARLQAGHFRAASTEEVFNAATVNGARMLGRDDIGRIAVGGKADFSLVDLSHPYMRPGREPLRSLIYSAGERAVRDVYVDGSLVVKDGKLLTIDIERAMQEVERAQAQTIATVSQRDYAGRGIDAMSPRVFPTRA
ncbi:N-ethylammeline chlorohydrolase [Achromobacter sp. RTa]|uniref:amidohydrolase family protein n=1 Tax=Achromobacter sp. RTa TaxID=1532557 RepID=UPI0005102000|nr:amidohydrolase family protein [Achromobacter sp. RTa]KGE00053.1 N-ethylammeline chlorohydrolase [Achromobacter sp. RTa]